MRREDARFSGGIGVKGVCWCRLVLFLGSRVFIFWCFFGYTLVFRGRFVGFVFRKYSSSSSSSEFFFVIRFFICRVYVRWCFYRSCVFILMVVFVWILD